MCGQVCLSGVHFLRTQCSRLKRYMHYWLLIIPLFTIIATWYVSTLHEKKGVRKLKDSEIRNSLRGKGFYVQLTNHDGTQTPDESLLINSIITFGGEVFCLPKESVDVSPDSRRVLIQGTRWRTNNETGKGTVFHFDLRMIAPNQQVLSARYFSGSKQEHLLFLILEWLAKPVTIETV